MKLDGPEDLINDQQAKLLALANEGKPIRNINTKMIP